jgi:hypothetical protein
VSQRIIWLGTWAACVLVVLLAGIVLVPRLLYPPLSAADLRGVLSAQARVQLQQAQSQLANDTRSTVLQGLGGLLVVVGAVATWWQVSVSREGQITERFTRAVDQLGSQNADVRIGGIYALERIASNSAADRRAIQFLLGAFVRNHAGWPVGAADGPQHPTPAIDEHLPWMQVRAPDIQAAMGALGRRPPAPAGQVLYLSRVDLRGVQLDGARLTGVQMRYANLARAWLRGTQLDRCDLKATDLRRANLERAALTSANLTGTYLQGANLTAADLSDADLRGANLTDAILDHATLTGARADSTTLWPADVDAGRRRELRIIETSHDGPDQMPAVTT